MPAIRRSTITATPPANAPIRIEGNILQDYGIAAAAEKTAKADKDALAARIKALVAPIYNVVAVRAATAGSEVPASVKFTDSTETVVEFQSKNAYGKITIENAEEVCTTLGVDVNEYFHEVPVVSFDTTVFTNPDGTFNETRFRLLQDALTTVAACLGIPNPLTVAEAVVPLPTFHTRRYRDLTVTQQTTLSEKITNTTALAVKHLTEPAAAATE